MTKLLKENIIIPALNIIKNDSKIKKFYLFPGLLSILFLTVLLVYQSIYTYVELYGNKEKTLEDILNFLHNSGYGFELIISAIIFLIVYFILMPIYEGGLIKYIHSKNSDEPMGTGDAFGQGLYNFFPIFEYNNIFSEFKIISILNAYLFTLRFIGLEYIVQMNYVFLVLLIFGVILTILFSYSKYIIILDNKSVFESIGESSKITILNLRRSIKLYFLMLILNMRVIFNFIIFLSFPIIMVITLGIITSAIFKFVAIIILSLLFIILIIALGYLTAVLEIFKTSVWYYAYIEGRKKLDK